VSVVHAVILRAPALSADAGMAYAASVAAAVRHARDDQDFMDRASSVPHGHARLVVQRVPPFDAAGNTGDGQRMDPTFVAGAFELRAPGDTTGVIETPFGWHVIRLVARASPGADELASRRHRLEGAVAELRVRGALGAVLRDRRLRTRVEIDANATARMAVAAAREQ
jgi:hypothetical protein